MSSQQEQFQQQQQQLQYQLHFQQQSARPQPPSITYTNVSSDATNTADSNVGTFDPAAAVGLMAGASSLNYSQPQALATAAVFHQNVPIHSSQQLQPVGQVRHLPHQHQRLQQQQHPEQLLSAQGLHATGPYSLSSRGQQQAHPALYYHLNIPLATQQQQQQTAAHHHQHHHGTGCSTGHRAAILNSTGSAFPHRSPPILIESSGSFAPLSSYSHPSSNGYFAPQFFFAPGTGNSSLSQAHSGGGAMGSWAQPLPLRFLHSMAAKCGAGAPSGSGMASLLSRMPAAGAGSSSGRLQPTSSYIAPPGQHYQQHPYFGGVAHRHQQQQAQQHSLMVPSSSSEGAYLAAPPTLQTARAPLLLLAPPQLYVEPGRVSRMRRMMMMRPPSLAWKTQQRGEGATTTWPTNAAQQLQFRLQHSSDSKLQGAAFGPSGPPAAALSELAACTSATAAAGSPATALGQLALSIPLLNEPTARQELVEDLRLTLIESIERHLSLPLVWDAVEWSKNEDSTPDLDEFRLIDVERVLLLSGPTTHAELDSGSNSNLFPSDTEKVEASNSTEAFVAATKTCTSSSTVELPLGTTHRCFSGLLDSQGPFATDAETELTVASQFDVCRRTIRSLADGAADFSFPSRPNHMACTVAADWFSTRCPPGECPNPDNTSDKQQSSWDDDAATGSLDVVESFGSVAATCDGLNVQLDETVRKADQQLVAGEPNGVSTEPSGLAQSSDRHQLAVDSSAANQRQSRVGIYITESVASGSYEAPVSGDRETWGCLDREAETTSVGAAASPRQLDQPVAARAETTAIPETDGLLHPLLVLSETKNPPLSSGPASCFLAPIDPVSLSNGSDGSRMATDLPQTSPRAAAATEHVGLSCGSILAAENGAVANHFGGLVHAMMAPDITRSYLAFLLKQCERAPCPQRPKSETVGFRLNNFEVDTPTDALLFTMEERVESHRDEVSQDYEAAGTMQHQELRRRTGMIDNERILQAFRYLPILVAVAAQLDAANLTRLAASSVHGRAVLWQLPFLWRAAWSGSTIGSSNDSAVALLSDYIFTYEHLPELEEAFSAALLADHDGAPGLVTHDSATNHDNTCDSATNLDESVPLEQKTAAAEQTAAAAAAYQLSLAYHSLGLAAAGALERLRSLQYRSVVTSLLEQVSATDLKPEATLDAKITNAAPQAAACASSAPLHEAIQSETGYPEVCSALGGDQNRATVVTTGVLSKHADTTTAATGEALKVNTALGETWEASTRARNESCSQPVNARLLETAVASWRRRQLAVRRLSAALESLARCCPAARWALQQPWATAVGSGDLECNGTCGG